MEQKAYYFWHPVILPHTTHHFIKRQRCVFSIAHQEVSLFLHHLSLLFWGLCHMLHYKPGFGFCVEYYEQVMSANSKEVEWIRFPRSKSSIFMSEREQFEKDPEHVLSRMLQETDQPPDVIVAFSTLSKRIGKLLQVKGYHVLESIGNGIISTDASSSTSLDLWTNWAGTSL